ncbi:MAG: glucans biosynthesis glucosyltransferase MdoH [Acidobacteriota bacterium]
MISTPENTSRQGQARRDAPAGHAGQRILAYLGRLPMSEPERLETALGVLSDASGQTPGQAPGQASGPEHLEQESMRLLLRRFHAPVPRQDVRATPPVKRSPMAPEFPRLKNGHGKRSQADTPPPEQERTPPGWPFRLLERRHKSWTATARARRLLLVLLIAAPTGMATVRMAELLPHRGSTILELVLMAIFSILFAWIAIGFWTAIAGFITLVRRSDRFAITARRPEDKPERPEIRTAIVYPVYGEDMDRVTAGIEAVHSSLVRAGKAGSFDFFILSDTRNPEAWTEEESAWAALRERLDGGSRIFYRRRKVNTKKKSGNIADFCRRFGACYTYMLVMDADSVMSGETIVRMVSVMERNRRVGILQSVPGVVGRDTLLARAQQFSSRLYGPMFSAGLHFWLLGDAQFWGHNALIRLRPFIRHCALPRLSGKPPLGGDISSHDFVESTLMRRAGWSVWVAYDLPGSYEETPPNLLAELSRDRRWCMGNMQHLRLVFSSGLFTIHRFLFINGVMAYGSALLWFLFLAASTAEAVIEALVPAVYFPTTKTLFPEWPIWEPWWALSLLLTTGVLLFLPKAFSFILAFIQGRARLFGGGFRLLASILLELVLSSLLAPIRMQFHAKFVFITLLGQVTGWETQAREDRPTPWSEAFRFHLGATLVAGLWATALYHLNYRFFWWVSPIFIPLLLSIPLSVITSLPGLGRWLRRMGLILIPEEVEPPRELVELNALHAENQQVPRPLRIPKGQGMALAVVDPAACALRLGLLRRPERKTIDDGQARRELLDKAVRLGPAGLTAKEKSAVLEDFELLSELHRAVWLLPADSLRRVWFADIT